MDGAIRLALKHSPELGELAHQANAQRQRLNAAKAGALPSFYLQGMAAQGPTGGFTFGQPTPLGITGDPLKKNYGGSLTMLLALFDSGRTRFSSEAERALYDASVDDLSAQRSSVVLEVKHAYLEVLRAQEVLNVREGDETRRKVAVSQAQASFDAGLRAGVDVDLAKASLAAAQSATISARNSVEYSYAALNTAMGLSSMASYVLDAPPQTVEGQSSMGELWQRAVQRRPEVRAAFSRSACSRKSELAERAKGLPRLDFVASGGGIRPSDLVTSNSPYAVGVLLTIPVYTGGLTEARVAESRELTNSSLDALERLKQVVKLQVTNASLSLKTRESQVTAAKSQYDSAESSLQQATERYKLGLSNYEELLTAETAALDAETQLVAAKFDLLEAQNDLEWSLGSIGVPYEKEHDLEKAKKS